MTNEGEATIVMMEGVITLTETERMIFNRLKEVINHNKLDTKLRVAGGWVRDKLLGVDCNDIDIAIDNMKGVELCKIIKAYLLDKGEKVKGGGVVASNAAKSKHLETAKMQLYAQSIDFVNLRSEDYSEESSTPTDTRFGKPEDDAKRRDLTINSLFYNINTDCVEDYTGGRGITDLQLGKIVTPLEPEQTFLDDPLRVLRAIRFGAKYSFTLDEGLKEAASSDEVRASMDKKISRERIGDEVDLMIGGRQSVKAIAYMCDLKLFWNVFDRPSVIEPLSPEACDRHCLAFIDAAWRLIQSLEAVSLTDDERQLCLYSALFLPLRNMKYKYNNNKERYVVDHIFRNSLKFKSTVSDKVIMIQRAAEKFSQIMSRLTSQENDQHGHDESSKFRILTGLVMREIKDLWQAALLVSALLYPYGSLLREPSPMEGEKSRELFMLVKNMITKQGLENIWETKPLVDGNEIKSILKLNGPCIGEWQQKVLEWQLANPCGTANECQMWMREEWRRLNNVKRTRMEATEIDNFNRKSRDKFQQTNIQ